MNRLQFIIQNLFPDKEIIVDKNGYLRINYWEELSVQEINEIETELNIKLEESEFADDDCGTLFTYKISNYEEVI